MLSTKSYNKFDRYLRLVHWLRKRYTGADGYLDLSTFGRPSRYSVLENLAAVRIMGLSDKYGPRT